MTDHNMYAASSQWASRPADERFWTLEGMHAACEASWRNSTCKKVPFAELRAVASPDGMMIGRQGGTPARLTHYAFGQLATSLGAPASYLRRLDVDTAAVCINADLARATDRSDRNLLFHVNGGLSVRAMLSEDYTRVWDKDVTRYLRDLGVNGWKAPAGRAPMGYTGPTRKATAADILEGQINIGVGTDIAPSGLYASDHDMFAFLVAPDRVIDDGTGKPLMRGVMVKNSEVGDSSLTFTFFLMQAVCGNHIIWNASGIHEVRIRHTGRDPFRKALREFEGELRRYQDAGAAEEGRILDARKLVLGGSKEEVIEALVKYAKGHSIPISRRQFVEGYDTAVDHESWYGNPSTLWANVAGLTHASQSTGFAGDRAEADRAAARMMAMAL